MSTDSVQPHCSRVGRRVEPLANVRPEAADPFQVDATPLLHTLAHQLIFAAGVERHSMARRKVTEPQDKLPPLQGVGLEKADAMLPAQPLEVLSGLSVEVYEGEVHPPDRTLEPPRDRRELLEVKGRRSSRTHDDRVVSPDHRLRSHPLRELVQAPQRKRQLGAVALQRPRITGQGEVKEWEVTGRPQVPKSGKERRRVARPEARGRGSLPAEARRARSCREGMDPLAVPLLEAPEKPPAVEGRDVASPAGTDDLSSQSAPQSRGPKAPPTAVGVPPTRTRPQDTDVPSPERDDRGIPPDARLLEWTGPKRR